MAILVIAEAPGRDLEVGEVPNTSNTREYIITSSVPDEAEAVVRLSADQFGNRLPAILARHPTIPGLRCTSVKVKQQADDNTLWRATVRWTQLQMRARNQSSDPDKRDPNPLNRPAILTFGTERFQRAARRTIIEDGRGDGRLIANSAGDPPDPPVMFDDFRPTFTITKNVPVWDMIAWRKAVNTLNKVPFFGLDPFTVRLVGLTGQEGFENEVRFFTKVGTFHCATDFEGNWDAYPRDCGFHYLDEGFDPNTGQIVNVKKPITMDDGSKPSVARSPDGKGGILPEGGKLVYGYLDPDTGEQKGFEVYYSMDHNTLGFT